MQNIFLNNLTILKNDILTTEKTQTQPSRVVMCVGCACGVEAAITEDFETAIKEFYSLAKVVSVREIDSHSVSVVFVGHQGKTYNHLLTKVDYEEFLAYQKPNEMLMGQGGDFCETQYFCEVCFK